MAHRLLHGTLHATILEADKLSDPTRLTGAAPQIFRKFVAGLEETVGRGKGSTQLYATIDLGRARVGRTRVITGDPVNPRWYEDFHIYCAHFAADVVFSVKVAQPISATLIGRAYLPVKDLLDAAGHEIDRRLDVLDAKKKKLSHGPTIHVRLEKNPMRPGLSLPQYRPTLQCDTWQYTSQSIRGFFSSASRSSTFLISP